MCMNYYLLRSIHPISLSVMLWNLFVYLKDYLDAQGCLIEGDNLYLALKIYIHFIFFVILDIALVTP
jgi:hypothetical protein